MFKQTCQRVGAARVRLMSFSSARPNGSDTYRTRKNFEKNYTLTNTGAPPDGGGLTQILSSNSRQKICLRRLRIGETRRRLIYLLHSYIFIKFIGSRGTVGQFNLRPINQKAKLKWTNFETQQVRKRPS